MATHGKKSRCLVDGYSMTTIARGLGVRLMKEMAECSVIELDDKEYQPGQKGASISVAAIYKGSEQTVKEALGASISGDDTHQVAYGPGGFAPGAPVYFGRSHENSASAVGDNKSVVSVALAYEITGGLALGHVLVSPFG